MAFKSVEGIFGIHLVQEPAYYVVVDLLQHRCSKERVGCDFYKLMNSMNFTCAQEI